MDFRALVYWRRTPFVIHFHTSLVVLLLLLPRVRLIRQHYYFHRPLARRKCFNWNFQVIQLDPSNLSTANLSSMTTYTRTTVPLVGSVCFAQVRVLFTDSLANYFAVLASWAHNLLSNLTSNNINTEQNWINRQYMQLIYTVECSRRMKNTRGGACATECSREIKSYNN